ncbi:MAG: response regulator transcription factor [Nocardioides sp.]
MIRVVVADDHPVMRNGLAALLGSLEGIEVVARAADGREALREAVLHRPDVVLLDLQMPGTDGFQALREISRALPGTAVCVLTMFSDDDSLFAAMRAGARGYVLKGAEQEEIERAVRGVAAGEAVFGPSVAQRVLAQLTAPPRPADPFPQLTPREREVLDLMASGRSPREVAALLGLAAKTVGNVVSNILTKLQLTDRAQAAIVAREAGMGGLGAPGSGPTG